MVAAVRARVKVVAKAAARVKVVAKGEDGARVKVVAGVAEEVRDLGRVVNAHVCHAVNLFRISRVFLVIKLNAPSVVE